MNRLPLLAKMIELKKLDTVIDKATYEQDVAWIEELMLEKYQLESELY